MVDSLPAADAMILLASEHLWPNLQSLVHWADGLKLVCIYEPAGAPGAAAAGQLLESLCRARYPAIDVQRAAVADGARPDAVERQIEAWRRGFPDRTWLVNASGGTRLMFAGILPFIGQPGLTVILHEGADPWSLLGPRSNGSGIALTPLQLPPGETDRIPVQTLIETVWKRPEGSVEFGKECPRLDVLQVTRLGIQERWNWDWTLQAAGHSSEECARLGFTDLIAQALRDLGIENLATHVRLFRPGRHGEDQLDIVANHRGRLLFLDCNLDTGEREKITMVIRQAAQTRRALGGLDARGCLLRPHRSIHPNLHVLAEELSLRIVDEEQAGSFFSRLAQWVDQPLPAHLAEADAALRDALAQRTIRQVFVPSPQVTARERGPRPSAAPARPAPVAAPPASAAIAAPSVIAAPRAAAQSSPPAAPPLDPAFREKVKVKVLGPLDQGNLVGLFVQEDGKPRGILAYGIRPDQLPASGEVIEVYRNNLDPATPQYRWDPLQGAPQIPRRGRRRGRRG